MNALWDTGASGTVITDNVVQALGLTATGMTKCHGVQGEHVTETYLINLRLLNGVGFVAVPVTKGVLNGFDALIGMDIISKGDFAISQHSGRTVCTFRVPSTQRIDFVQDSQREKAEAARKALIKHRPDKKRRKK